MFHLDHRERRHEVTLPHIPRPQPQETPVEEILTETPSHHDARGLTTQAVTIRESRYNKLYGTDRVLGSWRWRIDDYVSGTITTVANAQATAAVTLGNDPYWRLGRWPGARQAHLCIRLLALCPRTAPTTIGTLVCTFQDLFTGKTTPLGIFPSTAGGNDYIEIIAGLITDPDIVNIGQLQITLNGTSPSTAVYDWQLGFSIAYLLPEERGFERPYSEIRGEIEKRPPHHPGE